MANRVQAHRNGDRPGSSGNYIAVPEGSRHFRLGEDMRPDDGARLRKLGCIGYETVWHYPPAVDAEISDCLHSRQSGSRREAAPGSDSTAERSPGSDR